MENTTSSAAAPSETENPGGAASSMPYQSPARSGITRDEKPVESIAPLGTPQERLEMLQNEVRNAGMANLPIKFDFVASKSGKPILVITVAGARACEHCGWWNLTAECQNDKCSGKAKLLPETLPDP